MISYDDMCHMADEERKREREEGMTIEELRDKEAELLHKFDRLNDLILTEGHYNLYQTQLRMRVCERNILEVHSELESRTATEEMH
jgi:hypothetical protein